MYTGKKRPKMDPISLVLAIARKRNVPVSFEVTRESGPPHMRSLLTRGVIGDIAAEEEGNGKKASKRRAAELMLGQLWQRPLMVNDGNQRQSVGPTNTTLDGDLQATAQSTLTPVGT